jgi:hypothetical protein
MPADLPGLDDLASSPLTHEFGQLFNPPGLTNFLGAVQVDSDLVAVRSVNFPPVSEGDTVSGSLFVDGRLFRSLQPRVTVRWRPDRVTRQAQLGPLQLGSTTVCPPGKTAVVVELRATNLGPSRLPVRLGLALSSRATVTGKTWKKPKPPDRANRVQVDRARSALVGVCTKSGAACVQGLDVQGQWVGPNMVEVTWELAPGETRRLGFVRALASTEHAARQVYAEVVGDVPGAVARAQLLWEREIAEAFCRGAGSFGGSLPVLETESDTLRRLYWTGLLGVMIMRRDCPEAYLGRGYDTLMPRYWQTSTFIWDYSLSSVVHALLDPGTMCRQLEHWITTGVDRHYGTNWLTGQPFGVWYAVNDYAMTRLVRDYVRYTGDRAWLDRPVPDRGGRSWPVRKYVDGWATRWQRLRRGDSGLADYGDEDNLLECVSTYTHEVAGLNAMNVWCLRVAAEVSGLQGDEERAQRWRDQAGALAADVLSLYEPGTGYWMARRGDGTAVPVRHCYDLQTAGFALADDLSQVQRDEIIGFFRSDLQTKTWMRAMSTADPDAAWTVRPDHQWTGAYTAWPAEAAQALYRLGAEEVVRDWLVGLARSTQEGPFAQGHFVEGLVPASHDGAPKAPPEKPYLMDWACSSSGSFVGLILEGVFGLRVGLDGQVSASPRLAGLDPAARLTGLFVGGAEYEVGASGATRVSPG